MGTGTVEPAIRPVQHLKCAAAEGHALPVVLFKDGSIWALEQH